MSRSVRGIESLHQRASSKLLESKFRVSSEPFKAIWDGKPPPNGKVIRAWGLPGVWTIQELLHAGGIYLILAVPNTNKGRPTFFSLVLRSRWQRKRQLIGRLLCSPRTQMSFLLFSFCSWYKSIRLVEGSIGKELSLMNFHHKPLWMRINSTSATTFTF